MLGERFEEVRQAATAGEPAALDALWRDAQPALLRYLGPRAGDHAEDLASETWLRVMDSLAGFSGTEPAFRRWLVTIARNLLVDHVRRTRRRPETAVADLSLLPRPRSAADPLLDAAGDPAGVCAADWSLQDALTLVDSLPAASAELVRLRVVEGLDVAEVARLTGRTPGAVRVALHRALRRLGAEAAHRWPNSVTLSECT